jgi:threonine dehydratase
MTPDDARAPGAVAHRLSLERIARAASVIDPVFLDSPQYRAEPLEADLDSRLVVKVETANPIRSFKGRGTEHFTAILTGRPHLVCATAGNFGQGMAWSARKRGLALTVFAATTANPLKIERMRALGAEVRLAGADVDLAHEEARAFAERSGARLVEDGRDVAIAEGAGTIAIELLHWPEPFDAIVVPVGDGALIGGVALADLTGLVDDFVLVDDAALLSAMRRAHQDLGLVLEPAGAAGLAAVLGGGERFRARTVGTILTGGNLTTRQAQEWLTG